MNAVAIITPDPKYFNTKNTIGCTFTNFVLARNIGTRAPISLLSAQLSIHEYANIPAIDPIPITNTEEILAPKFCDVKSLSPPHCTITVKLDIFEVMISVLSPHPSHHNTRYPRIV
jgi:hypothetical protein